MISLHYVIATYSGIYRTFEDKEYVLQRQLQVLYNILKEKRDDGIKCLLRQITIVCPRVHHPTAYQKYYQKELWSYVFAREFPDVKLVYLDYVGENKDHSYDQWIQGYAAYPEYDYHLFMEDDYCFDQTQVNFDQDLINLYKEKFPNNIGYMATWSSNHNGHEYHAAISNGLVSRDSFKQFSDPLKTYYEMGAYVSYPQLKFSRLFTRHNILLSDITDKYQALFWDSETFERINYGSDDKTQLLYPVQFTGLDTSSSAPKRKKVAFLVTQFSIRGSEIAIYDYACYNEIILNNESVFVLPSNYKSHCHPTNGPTHSDDVEQKFRNTFPVHEFDDLDTILEEIDADVFYALKAGNKDQYVSKKVPNAIHAVFYCEEEHKHGDYFACISETINKCAAPVVPHICTGMPKLEPVYNFGPKAIIIGRYGGKESFDIDFVPRTIEKALESNHNLHFLFMNTPRVVTHSRVHYIEKDTSIEGKARFINSCHAMLHARKQGESFGLAIAEFTTLGKTIITWKHDGPRQYHEDINHIDTLGDTGVYYRDEKELYELLVNFDPNRRKIPVNYATIYDPRKVMKLFGTVFLNQKKYIKIKVLCNWTKNIHTDWKKLIGKHPVQFVDNNPDYWVIINKPPPNSKYDPARTIVMGMEPDTFTGERWNGWYKNKEDFLYFLDHNYLNNIEWWLSKSHDELLEHTPEKKYDLNISAVVSSQYLYTGHKLRIDFLREAEKELKFDIYGWQNKFGFSSYRGELKDNKNEGLFPYKYTFAAENTSRPNYMTEKLIDGILAECLVFYWGCPNVSDYFDPRCYIPIDISDITNSIRKIRQTIYNGEWEKRISVIRKMKKRILNHYAFIPRLLGLIEVEKLNKKTVNMDSRPEKWQKHVMECQRAFVPNVQRYSAIAGDSLDLNSKYIKDTFLWTQNFIGPGKNTGGIVGCALSHYNLWQEVVQNNLPMLVVEDDITYQERFVDRLAFVLQKMKGVDWDVIFIGFHNHEHNLSEHGLPDDYLTKCYTPTDLITYQDMIKYGTPSDASGLHGGGTFGYVISPKGAQRLVEMVKKCKFYFPVDYQMLECGLHYGLKIYAVPHQLLTSPKFGLDTDISDIQT